MPYQILCNGTFQKSQEARSELGLASPHRTSLHNNRYGVHSYGGMVITGVVDAVPERIAHLVYLDTFVPRDGESMVDVSPLVIRLLLRKQAHGDGWRVDSQGTYGVTTEPDRTFFSSRSSYEHSFRSRSPRLSMRRSV
jgi:pimeloyl-ACP methyl ester carboxylesterase